MGGELACERAQMEKFQEKCLWKAPKSQEFHQNLVYLKISVRGKFAILHNFTFLNGWINLKVIFKIKKLDEEILYLSLVILRERFFAY